MIPFPVLLNLANGWRCTLAPPPVLLCDSLPIGQIPTSHALLLCWIYHFSKVKMDTPILAGRAA
jgi:hypothetical protein